MKRSVALVVSALVGALFFSAGSAAAGAASYCGITWGSLPDTVSVGSADATVANVRSGKHPCLDRLVADVNGDVRGFDVRYVSQVVADGSGAPIFLRGAADLQVIALVAAYSSAGVPTWRPANPHEALNVAGYETFRQVAFAGSFEGRSNFGIGVRARLPFRTFVLDGPGNGSRLVVDVAHRW